MSNNKTNTPTTSKTYIGFASHECPEDVYVSKDHRLTDRCEYHNWVGIRYLLFQNNDESIEPYAWGHTEEDLLHHLNNNECEGCSGWYDADDKPIQFTWESLIEEVRDSVVDCDSSSAMFLIDTVEMKAIASSGSSDITFMTSEDYDTLEKDEHDDAILDALWSYSNTFESDEAKWLEWVVTSDTISTKVKVDLLQIIAGDIDSVAEDILENGLS